MIWWSERDGWPHLWRFDATAGIATVVTSDAGDDGDGDAAARVVTTGEVKVRNQITAGAWAAGDVHWVDETKKQIWFS